MTEDQIIQLLRRVRKPGNVYGYKLAEDLRDLNRAHPGLVKLSKPVGDFDGVGEVPYLGVKLTVEGEARLARANAPSRRS